MTLVRRQRRVVLIFLYVIQPADFIIRKNLMAELAKINRVIERELPDSARETLLVLDATTGQKCGKSGKIVLRGGGYYGNYPYKA